MAIGDVCDMSQSSMTCEGRQSRSLIASSPVSTQPRALTKTSGDETTSSSSVNSACSSAASSTATSRSVSDASLSSSGWYIDADQVSSSRPEFISEDANEAESCNDESPGCKDAASDEVKTSTPEQCESPVLSDRQRTKRPSLSLSMNDLTLLVPSIVKSGPGGGDDNDDATLGSACMTADQLRRKRMIKRKDMHIPELLLPGTKALRKRVNSAPNSVKLRLVASASFDGRLCNPNISPCLLSPPPMVASISADSLARFEPSGACSVPNSPDLRHRSPALQQQQYSFNDDDVQDYESELTDANGDPLVIPKSRRPRQGIRFPASVSASFDEDLPSPVGGKTRRAGICTPPQICSREGSPTPAAFASPTAFASPGTVRRAASLGSPRLGRSLTKSPQLESPVARTPSPPRGSPSRRLLKLIKRT